MNISVTDIMINVLVILLMAVPGYILAKRKMLENATSGLTNILFYVCQPLLTFVCFQKISYQKSILSNMGLAFLFSLIGMLICMLIYKFVFIKWKNVEKAKVYKFGCVFSNCAFFGIPLLQSICGKDNPEIIIYTPCFITAFNLLSWTLGIYVISGDKSYINIKKAILNPPTISFFISLPFFFLNLHLNDFSSELFNGISVIANMITPISMIIIGIKLSEMQLKDVFLSKGIYFATFLKLIISPLIMILIMLPFKLDTLLTMSLFFSMAMPAATTTAIFCEKFGGDAKEGAAIVMANTVLCFITIPLMYQLFLIL